jgi:hypothetical protein
MNELNLHGRLPNNLPDKMTINDILLELEDTNKFDINLINLQSTKVDGGKWYANNKEFHEWVEQGEVRICEADYSSMRFNLDINTPSVLTIKETLYHVVRYPMRLSVNFLYEPLSLKNYSLININKDNKELIDTSNEVYLRLKDYLGPDVIQDQFGLINFTIDFMISRCKII